MANGVWEGGLQVVDSDNNTTDGIYTFLAFAETPFKYANGR